MPDQKVAEECNSTASIVGRYRRKYDIPPYEGYKFGKGQEPPSKGPAAPSGRKKSTGSGGGSSKRRRGSKIDAFLEDVGRVSDAIIAEKAGVSVEGVRMYRRRNGIDLDPNAHLNDTLVSAAAAEAAVEVDDSGTDEDGGDGRARRSRRSKIDPFRDQVGKVPDTEIATLAEVTPEAVRMYRRKHHIAATWREDEEESVTTSSSSPSVAVVSLSRGDLQGYAVTVQQGGATVEMIMLATNIAEAAARAVQKTTGDVVAVRHLGPALL